MKVANYVAGPWKTLNQLKAMGRVPKEGVDSVVMWTNQWCQWEAEYYRLEDSREMTAKELEAYRNECRAKNHEYYLRRKEKLRIRRLREGRAEHRGEYARGRRRLSLGEFAERLEAGANVVFYDLETTGLDPDRNGIVEIALVDREGAVLYHSRLRPADWLEWTSGARKVNGIHEKDVEDAPTIEEARDEIQAILDKADVIVGYNNQAFDDGFMAAEGFRLPAENFDAFPAFNVIYGEWDEYHNEFRWQSLGTAASYYDYNWEGHAHGALSDALATLHVAKAMAQRE